MTAVPSVTSAPPPPGPATDVRFPPCLRMTLPNGLKVRAVEHRALPRASLLCSIAVGDRDDPPGAEGTATLMARLLKEGTANRRAAEIALSIESVGGTLDAGADMDRSMVAASVLTAHLPLALDLVAEALQYPVFSPAELDLARGRLEQEIRALRSDPEFLAEELCARACYGDHPYGRLAPTPATLGRITRGGLLRFHLERCTPEAVTILAVGDFRARDLAAKVAERFRDFRGGRVAPAPRRPLARRNARVHLLDRPDSVQSVLRLAAPFPDRTHADFVALEVTNQLLGGAASSRLFQNLRQLHGYSYAPKADIVQRPLASQLVLTASVRTDVTAAALREMERELLRLAREDVPEEELSAVKQEMIGQFPLSLESQRAIAARLLTIEILGLKADYWTTYRQRLHAVRAADVRRVARRYLAPDRFKIAMVGRARAVARALEPFGRVEVHSRGPS